MMHYVFRVHPSGLFFRLVGMDANQQKAIAIGRQHIDEHSRDLCVIHLGIENFFVPICFVRRGKHEPVIDDYSLVRERPLEHFLQVINWGNRLNHARVSCLINHSVFAWRAARLADRAPENGALGLYHCFFLHGDEWLAATCPDGGRSFWSTIANFSSVLCRFLVDEESAATVILHASREGKWTLSRVVFSGLPFDVCDFSAGRYDVVSSWVGNQNLYLGVRRHLANGNYSNVEFLDREISRHADHCDQLRLWRDPDLLYPLIEQVIYAFDEQPDIVFGPQEHFDE